MMNRKSVLTFRHWAIIPWVIMFWLVSIAPSVFGQSVQPPEDAAGEQESADEVLAELPTILLAPTKKIAPPFLYAASSRATANVATDHIQQTIEVNVRFVQGKPQLVSLGLLGSGEVINVAGEQIESWAVRKKNDERFLDIQVSPKAKNLTATIEIRTEVAALPLDVELAHLAPGDALGFDSSVQIQFASAVTGKVIEAEGFVPVASEDPALRLQTSIGGKLTLRVERDGLAIPAVDLQKMELIGQRHTSGQSVSFQLKAKAVVNEANARIQVLQGDAALSQLPENSAYRIELAYDDGKPSYQIVFPEPGEYDLTLDFIAAIRVQGDWSNIDIRIATSAVAPLRLEGFDGEIEFRGDQQSVLPQRVGEAWSGYLPANGRLVLKWMNARGAVAGKLFFTTTALVEASVGTGLVRQIHTIDYQILQGKLSALQFSLHGPGEILNIRGPNIIGWQVVEDGETRRLEVSLSQPLTTTSQFIIDCQTAMNEFPTQVQLLRILPLETLRHSGFVRVQNSGSVRIEPRGIEGLTQLAPENFPGEPTDARQLFVYRFPSGDYQLPIAADRIQPEVNVSLRTVYQLTESEKSINCDAEFDIREAPIREWDLAIPADYAVVAVSGASVADYVVGSDSNAGQRNLKIIFTEDIAGRQLITVRLEKNETATEGSWSLPPIEVLGAESVRGDIGVAAAAGFRITNETTEQLTDKPLSYFPLPVANLQQAYRIRDPQWKATVRVEQLPRSVQADLFHLYSLSDGTIYGSTVVNLLITGSPTGELVLRVPTDFENVTVDGKDIRTWRREGDRLEIMLHQRVIGAYTALVTFEQKPAARDGSFDVGQVSAIDVDSERGYIEVVSPVQIELEPLLVSNQLLALDALELPAEFRLLSTAPSLGTWQYTQRPFDLKLRVNWFEPGTTTAQVVEFSEVNSKVSPDGELVTDITYFVKARGQRTLRVQMPPEPVKLWAVTIDGQPINARQTETDLLIPLPGTADPTVPIQVGIRIGKPSIDDALILLELPTVDAPALKTQWKIFNDQQHVLVPTGAGIAAVVPVKWPTGFDWIANRGFVPFLAIGLLVISGVVLCFWDNRLRYLALILFAIAIGSAVNAGWDAWERIQPPQPLEVSLPVLYAGEQVSLEVANVPSWQVQVSWLGIILAASGFLLAAVGLWVAAARPSKSVIAIALGLVLVGVLLQLNGGAWFFLLIALLIFGGLLIPLGLEMLQAIRLWFLANDRQQDVDQPQDGNPSAIVVSSILACLVTIGSWSGTGQVANADDNVPTLTETLGVKIASAQKQQWNLISNEGRLAVDGEVTVIGKPGDSFLLLQSPATLTEFNGENLQVTKTNIGDRQWVYLLSIQRTDNVDADPAVGSYSAKFRYQVDGVQSRDGIPLLTGDAALQELNITTDQPGWQIACASAAFIEQIESPDGQSQFRVLLGPGQAKIVLQPPARNVSAEEPKFFVEGSQLYTPAPGVVEGRHQFAIRAAQGRISELQFAIPDGITVGSVSGPVSSWQFDAETRRLRLQIEGESGDSFQVVIDTQRELAPLPVSLEVEPLRVLNAEGQTGLMAIAFGAEAQPEKVEAKGMSAVTLTDFDSTLKTSEQAVLHRVYRYTEEADVSVTIRVAPVSPEVRVTTRQVLSLGDERVLLSINVAAEISRTGLFQLSFPLPNGFEVESLSGDSLHHWSEVTEGESRQVVLHLKGKMLGTLNFALALTGTTPATLTEWSVPTFQINEAVRQSGDFVIQPTTGLRLRTVSRQGVTELDPRELGGKNQGALAFRLLQKDWNLTIGIEQLEPWVTAQVLQEVAIREGQARTTLYADFDVQNASLRSLNIKIPGMTEEVAKTVRASGRSVAAIVQSTTDGTLWELQFKQRIVGGLQFQIEFERRGDIQNDQETLIPLEFPEARQMTYYCAIRTGGRIEVQANRLSEGWQEADWSSVPLTLRDAGTRTAPAQVLRAASPTTPLSLQVTRHAIADSLKLRVAKGTLTTLLSPTGDQLTAVEVTVEVIQRSNLTIQLPSEAELINIFVNGESVHTVKQATGENVWRFYILPGIDDRTAQVRFVCLTHGERFERSKLISPLLNVPLENVTWNVIVPQGYELIDNDGNLELKAEEARARASSQSYLATLMGKRQDQAAQAAKLLQQANQLLQAGEQSKAHWAFNSVANRYALDAASNEDARVQLENLQTQQAVVGLNTRRQRLYLDSSLEQGEAVGNQQWREAAASNPILQEDRLNFRPQDYSQLLAGNTSDDNAVLAQIANRLVRHQRSAELAPQALVISLAEEGRIYSFSRSVQVTENAPLQLDLTFHSRFELRNWQWLVIAAVVLLLAISITIGVMRKPTVTAGS